MTEMKTYQTRPSENRDRNRIEPPKPKDYIPTPQEYAQQVADMLNKKVILFQKTNGVWWYDTVNSHVYISEVKRGHVWVHSCQANSTDHPINYTGDWQDSKVSAEPRKDSK